jgi:D-alanine-D-alanine ligase-like ATP-grasp enzyme
LKEYNYYITFSSIRLTVAGIDLRLTSDGKWYCFEVNPSPAFTFQAATNHRVDEAIADLLIAGKA